MAPGILLMSVSQVSTGILQGVGKMIHPVCSMILGAMVKLFVGVWLIRIPSLNILGAAWGTLLYFGVNAVVDTLLAVRYAGVKIGFGDALPRGLLSAGIMGGVVYVCFYLFRGGVWITVLAGAVGYGILLIVTKTVTAEELGFGDRKILKRSRREL
jgi:stage V sporulation protein B